MIRFDSYRKFPNSRPGVLGYISKNKDDVLSVAINYSRILVEGDYLTGLQLTGVQLQDRETDDNTILLSTTGTVLGGIINDYVSNTKLDTGANQTLAGLLQGDKFIAINQNWTSRVLSFDTTNILNDTIVHEEKTSSAGPGDMWACGVGTFTVQEGSEDTQYLIEAKATTQSGQIILDHVLLSVYAKIEGSIPD